MQLQHFYSDVNGTKVDGARLATPTESEIEMVVKNGKMVSSTKETFHGMFSDGTVLEVRNAINGGGVYRDMYRIIN